MLAYTYVKKGVFALEEKPRPAIQDSRDAIVRVTLGSICTSARNPRCSFPPTPSCA